MGGSAKITVAAVAAASVMGTATAGRGQAMSPMVYNGFIGGSAVAAAGRRSRDLNGLGPDGRPSAARSHERRAVSTRYNRNPAVTRKVEAQFSDYVARVAGPQKAQVVRTELGKRDFVQAWTVLAAADGFKPGDAAEAMAAYWVLNWAMANGQDPAPRQSAGARAQLHANLPYNPAFASFSEDKRQEMAETFMINYIYQQGLYADALKSGDRVMQKRLSDAAEARFQNEMHTDLRGLALTERGFAPKG